MRDLIDRYLAAYNRIDVPGMLATVHPGVVFENYAGGQCALRVEGLLPFQQLALQTAPLFAQRHQQIVGYVEQGNEATAQILFEGVFAIDLPNGVRAGQSIRMPGRSVYRIHEGRLIYIADFSD